LRRQAYEVKEALDGRQPIIFLKFFSLQVFIFSKKKAKINKERKKMERWTKKNNQSPH